jgi:hypothetical protein
MSRLDYLVELLPSLVTCTLDVEVNAVNVLDWTSFPKIPSQDECESCIWLKFQEISLPITELREISCLGINFQSLQTVLLDLPTVLQLEHVVSLNQLSRSLP